MNKDMQKAMDDIFNEADKLFKEMDKVFKQVDKTMEEAFVQQGPVEREPWKAWFAWRPVKIKGKYKWFKVVYRREIPKTYVDYDDWTRYEYGDLFDAIRDSGTNS